jgi:hypothetical protein
VKKILVFIMAILVLSAGMIPCADETSSNNGAVNFSLSKTAGEEPHADTCSPFCICSCCTSFSVTSSISLPVSFAIPYTIAHSSFFAGSIYSVALPIWQPPRRA